jgi:serine protease Do
LTVVNATPEVLKKMNIARKEPGGVVVTEVAPYSAAAVAGLEPGDVITEAGGRQIMDTKDFEEAMRLADGERGILVLLERAAQKTFAILKP